MTSATTETATRWVPLREPGFRWFLAARLANGFAVQIETVAIGWQVYDITRDPLDLGLVGLTQFLPALLLVFVTGTVADRFRRRTIMSLCLAFEAVFATALLVFSIAGITRAWPIFLVLAGFGTARAFYNPAQQSLLPNLVEPGQLARAVATNSAATQIAVICGPVAGGLLYGISAATAYGSALVLLLAASVFVALIPRPLHRSPAQPRSLEALVAGFRYVWNEKIVLGAISLDLFAVLLGGAVALLPVYARDILDVGAAGLGLLRAAPAVGAIAVALWLSAHPIRDHAGLMMFFFIGVFGIAHIVFGLSTLLWLSIAMLVLAGAADMISVNVRQTLIQLWTPDAVRGRVNAINSVFIGASNELGAFRAGIVAALIGAVPAVVLGGVGTLMVTALWLRWFPELRRARHLDGRA